MGSALLRIIRIARRISYLVTDTVPWRVDVSAVGAFDHLSYRGGADKVIASIEDPAVIKQILADLPRKAELTEFNPLPESRAGHRPK